MDGLSEFIKVFGDIKIVNVIEWVIAIGFLILLLKNLQSYFEKKLAQDSETKKNTQKILEATDRIPQIEKKVDDLEKNQAVQMSRIESIENENKRRECSQLRERIMQSYRFQCDPTHNPRHEITELEHMAFEEAFEDYISAGGDGYLKEVIKPDFDTLTVIKMSDTEAIARLMHSRN